MLIILLLKSWRQSLYKIVKSIFRLEQGVPDWYEEVFVFSKSDEMHKSRLDTRLTYEYLEENYALHEVRT
jgi:hypothetical protein